ncbi:MAG: hypothetical protein AB7O77_06585 [Phycisphaerales bacterium]
MPCLPRRAPARVRWFAGLILPLSWLGGAPRADAQPHIPHDSVLWWTWDPAALSPPNDPGPPPHTIESRLASGLLRAASASGIVEQPLAADTLRAVLAASEVFALPHTLCVLDLDEPAPDALRPRDRSIHTDVVIDLAADSTDIHRRLKRTLELILVLPDAQPPGSQRELILPGDRRAMSFRRPDWPDGVELAWCSSPGHFTIALGAGVLRRWFETQDAPPSPLRADFEVQRRTVAAAHPGARSAFTFALDCDRLRACLPAESRATPVRTLEGRVARMLREWNLANGRSFMLHAAVIPSGMVRTALTLEDIARDPPPGERTYFGPPLIALDATWSARSDPVDQVEHAALSESYWPQEALPFGQPRALENDPARPLAPDAPDSPRAAFAIVFRAAPTDAIETLAGFYSGLLDPGQGAEFEREFDRWSRASTALRQRESRRLGEYTIALGPASPGALPFTGLSLVSVLAPQADATQFDRELLTLLAPLKQHLSLAPAPPAANPATPATPVHLLSASSFGIIDLAAWRTLPGSGRRPGVFLAFAGVSLSSDQALRTLDALARWVGAADAP